MTKKIIFVVIALLAFCASAMARDIALVTHKANAIKAISVAELVKICKTTGKWSDGREMKLIYVDPETPAMKLVAEKVFGVSPDELRTMLEKMPGAQKLATDQAVVAAVEHTPGSLGLIDIYSITAGVNVLKLEGKLPLEPGYLLHRNQ